MFTKSMRRLRPSRLPAVAAMAAILALSMMASACSSSDEIQTNGVASLETETAADVESESAAAVDGAAGLVGDDDENNGDANVTESSGEVDAEQAALNFSQCMRDEGLDFPDIGLDANGNPDIREGFEAVRGQDGFRDVFQSCAEHLESTGFGGGRAALTENVEIQDAFVEFSACVREQGFDVGDLQFGAPGGGAGQGGQGADQDGAGQGANAQGGRGEGGFDPTRRFADGLGLDPEDPDVQAAIAECQSIIEAAFGAAGVTQP